MLHFVTSTANRWVLFLAVFFALFPAVRTDGAEVEWHRESGFRWHQLKIPSVGKTGFVALGPEITGVTFTNSLTSREAESNRVLANGSGVAIGDIDGDGLPDIFLCGLNGQNRLYRNQGDFHFTDITEASGIVVTNRYCRGAVFADIDGDGKVDLLVATTGNGVRCFFNKGNGRFSDETVAAGTDTPFGSVTMTLADVDGDGTLDLYVANNRTDDIKDRGKLQLQLVGGKMQVPPEYKDRLVIHNGNLLEYGEPDQFYFNDGHGHFRQVPWTNGVFSTENGVHLSGPPLDWGLTASFRDVNGDGWPDLYVCNDYWTPDRFWINDGHGKFRLAPKLALRNTSASSMGIDFADIDRNGSVDFLVVDMLSRDPQLRRRQMLAQIPAANPVGEFENRPQFMRNTLQHGRGDGTYAEIANFAGLSASDWSWSPRFLDIDLDGYPDLLVTAGHYRDVQDLDAQAQIDARKNTKPRGQESMSERDRFVSDKIENSRFYPYLKMPLIAYRNLRRYRFEEVTQDWGTGALGVHHALATADLDGDGDIDLVVNNLGSAAGIYRNESTNSRVAVRLKGLAPNTQGIGAKIILHGGGRPDQQEEVVCGGYYMSGSDPQITFGVPDSSQSISLEIKWRSGHVSRVDEVKADRFYEIEEPIAFSSAPSIGETYPNTLFEDVSVQLQHVHVDESFNDFDRQPLLPRKLSQLGPGISWGNWSGSGRDDLIIAGGKGGSIGVYVNQGGGRWTKDTNGPWAQPLTRDSTTVLLLPQADGPARLVVGQSSYEDGWTNVPNVVVYSHGGETVQVVDRSMTSAVGALALADFNGDGQLDLFMGGRVHSGAYPAPASSLLFRGDGKSFVLDEANSRLLTDVGMVTGAVWTDLDGDGFPELVLAREWGSIKVYHNHQGTLDDASQAWGMSEKSGWWTGVVAADFDGDGRMDLAVGNWGLNSPYRASDLHPQRLFFGEFSGNTSLDMVESEFNPSSARYESLRSRDALLAVFPDLWQRFPTHRGFSVASIEDILGENAKIARVVEATTLESTVFLNRGGHFGAYPLPTEAQWAPVYGIAASDVDGDGHPDLFLAQNFFDNPPEVPRLDAGRGLILLGRGDGTFAPISGQASGIRVYGEQRGAAFGDFDGDGRPDLAIGQNGATTKLYHNRQGKPGLRVRLKGPPGNPSAFGARVRGLIHAQWGPAWEVHCGGGYWSQDSPIVLISGGPCEAIDVVWPGGQRNQYPVFGSASEVEISEQGLRTIVQKK